MQRLYFYLQDSDQRTSLHDFTSPHTLTYQHRDPDDQHPDLYDQHGLNDVVFCRLRNRNRVLIVYTAWF